jgi:hypothetical protein
MKLLAVGALALALVGCGGGSINVDDPSLPTDDPAFTDDVGSEVEEEPDSEVAGYDFEPIRLSGKGSKVAKFSTPEGAAAIALISSSGRSTFAVWSISADGDENKLLVNEIGKYEGTVLFDELEGIHSVAFKVEASGSWKITVLPVNKAKKWDGVSTLKAKGDNVFQLSPASEGLTTVTLKFKGNGNFAVVSYSSSGIDLLANEIDDYSGETLLPDGTFLLEITADGSWSANPG